MQGAGRVDVERLEPEEGRAAEQRRVDLEVRVLGGGADEGEEAALDAGQQGVLLGLVEAVDLVEEEDRALAVLAEAVAGPLERVADVLHAGAHRAELLEGLAGVGGDGLGQGGLARARRPPQDHRRQPVGLDEGPERLARAEQVVLADDVVEGAGPQARRERRVGRQRLLRGGGEEVVGHGRRPYPTHPGRRTPQHITVPFRPSPSQPHQICVPPRPACGCQRTQISAPLPGEDAHGSRAGPRRRRAGPCPARPVDDRTGGGGARPQPQAAVGGRGSPHIGPTGRAPPGRGAGDLAPVPHGGIAGRRRGGVAPLGGRAVGPDPARRSHRGVGASRPATPASGPPPSPTGSSTSTPTSRWPEPSCG